MDQILRDTGKFVVAAVIPTIIGVFLLPASLKPLVFVYLALLVSFLIKYFHENMLFECPNCRQVFKPSLSAFVLSPHQTYYKLLRCPGCRMVSWCGIKFYKGKELDLILKPIKLKSIREEFKANLKSYLVFTTLVYILSSIPSVLNRNLAIIAAGSIIYLIYLITIGYGIKKGYRSQIYLVITFFVVIILLLFALLGFV
jgi:uncharacterized C2H2 Zn-finger protein